ncbi:autotransporter-associated beta strand repeat protein [Pedosphaera parvula Ellin514]|uniref:Autotransporter-associated beta strand repeat protein n=2 Tax=Pedosphaera TaxID=1032526 RepID=B9XHK5_PEDPL|nr:autotransporter-associated beta strand repeat protein [Pedosphaera parvula Ellin514]
MISTRGSYAHGQEKLQIWPENNRDIHTSQQECCLFWERMEDSNMKPSFAFVRWLALLLVGCGLTIEANAAPLSPHRLFSSHMVLQRDADDPLWGWATPGITVTVKVYNQNAALVQTKTAVAGSDGRWQVTVGPFGLVANNAAYSLTISDGATTLTLTDVLIGDVWLCAGQSNMQFSLNEIGVTNLAAEIADSANYPAIRNFSVPFTSSLTAETNLPSGSWQGAGPSTTGGFTAAGYFTAREIYKQQHIPIGIIRSAWAGSEIKSWLDPLFVSEICDFTQPIFDQAGQTPGRDTISGPYNAMIRPLSPFRIKAVEWYQGEYNVGWPEQYSRLLPGLMSNWRSLFGQPNLPFVIIQLPNFGNTQSQAVETGSWAELREAQLKTVLNDASARLVTTIDIGNGDLHPIDKQDVGQRAAWAAANLVYGQQIVDQAPVLAGTMVSGNTIICTFTNVGAGLMAGTKTLSPLSPAQQTVGGALGGFAICGANKVFFAASAVITATNQVTVTSAGVTTPVAVRYAWGSNPPGNLYNKITDAIGAVTNGVPVGSFRSDPVNRLVVISGTGTGYYSLGSQVAITASNLTGLAFHHWSGDTNLFSTVNGSTATLAQAQEYVSVLANYQITGAPSGVMATAQPSQIALTWNPMVAVHYNVKRSGISGGPYTTVASNLVGVANYVDANVIVGTTYYYVVSAANLLGEGPNSFQVSAIPTGGVPISTNTWDANGTTGPNPVDGSGSWLTASNWWNGSANVNGHWTNSPSDSAIFGTGTAGNYTINLGGNSLFASNVVFSTSGYTLTNGTLTLSGSGTPLMVNAGVTATLKNALTTSLASTFQVSSAGTLSLAGGATLAGNTILTGGGTVDLNAGTFAGPNFVLWTQTPVTQGAATLNTARIMVGYGGNSTYTLNSAGAQATSSGGGGDSFIGRAGSAGTWELKQGTVTLTAASGDSLRVGFDGSSKGTLTVEGGVFNLGGNTLYINHGATSSGGAGTVNLSGGTLLAGAVQFGGGGTFIPGASAALNVTGGTLYVGPGGISRNALGTLASSITLSGGVIGAAGNWSSSEPMGLANGNGNITFQAADAGNNAKDIALSGGVSGTGGLIKTGSGKLTLSGANTYTGGNIINAGTLSLTTTNNVSMPYINNGGILEVRQATVGSSLAVSTLTLGSGSPQLNFDLANLGNTIAPLISGENLTLNGNATVNVFNAPSSGTSVLLTYSGTRGGAGNFVAGTVPSGAVIIDDVVGKKVSLAYPSPPVPMILTISYDGPRLNLSGTNGPTSGSYRILSSTNLADPLWISLLTNAFDAGGAFNATIPVNREAPAVFFRVTVP